MGKELFLNRRTRQPGYIKIEEGSKLSQTQVKDLIQVVHWVKCKYHFPVKDIADFIGVPRWIVEECLEETNISCISCWKKMEQSQPLLALN